MPEQLERAEAPRVLLVTQHFAPELTGNAPYASSLATGLSERGCAVQVHTTHPHYPEWRFREDEPGWREERLESGVSVVRLRHFLPKRQTGVGRALSELSFGLRALTARTQAADIVILVSPALLASGVAALRWPKRKKIVWVQDIYTLGLTETGAGGRRVAAVMAQMEGRILRRAGSTWASHERFRRFITDRLFVKPENVEVMRNWTHLRPVAELPDRAEVRRRLGWSTDEIVVLHAGNQGQKQGLDNVVEAARAADALAAPIRFVLLGGGNQHERLQALAAGVERIQFMPPLPDNEYTSAMLASDVLLVSQRAGVNEMSVPSKLTSYMATGRPILAVTESDSVTSEELVASGAGVRVDPDQPVALVHRALDLGRDTELAQSIASNGKRFVSEVLDMESAMTNAYARLRRQLGLPLT